MEAHVEITLNGRRGVVLVSAIDSEWAKQYTWCKKASRKGKTSYAHRYTWPDRKNKCYHMHREILSRMLGRDLLPGEQCDHIDGDGLNNCRDNLRLATNGQNQHNRAPNRAGSSRFKGVWWSKDREKWRTQIQCDRKVIRIGHFDSETEAARAYDHAALRYHGEFAWLNFPICSMCDEEIPWEISVTGERYCSPICREVAKRENVGCIPRRRLEHERSS